MNQKSLLKYRWLLFSIILVLIFVFAMTDKVGKEQVSKGLLKDALLSPNSKQSLQQIERPTLVTILPMILMSKDQKQTHLYLWIPLDQSNHYLRLLN